MPNTLISKKPHGSLSAQGHRELHQLIREKLGLPELELNATTKISDLGVSSLKVYYLIGDIELTFGVFLGSQSIYQIQTFGDLERLIDESIKTRGLYPKNANTSYLIQQP